MHHIVQGLVKFFRNVSVIHLFGHERFKETINGGFKFINRSFGEFGSSVGQFEFFLKTGDLGFEFVFFFGILDGDGFSFLDLT